MVKKKKLAFSTLFHQFFFKDTYNDIYLEEKEEENVKVIFNVENSEPKDNDHH